MKNKSMIAITKRFGPRTTKTVKKLSTNGKLFSVPVRMLLTRTQAPSHLSITGPAM
jgi:hypothetical protein